MYDFDIELQMYASARVKKYREECHYSRDTASWHLGISARTLASYESAGCEIPTNIVLEMSELYKVSFCTLIDYPYSLNAVK